MGNAVGGLRDSFYRDLRREYRDEGVSSFLYRYFWTEAVTELLEEYVPQLPVECPVQLENSGRIRALLEEAVRERPDLLLRPAPEKQRRKSGGEAVRGQGKKERRDFWEELWLNDAGYQANLLSDTDYYLWLVEYLAVHDLYYKDTSMWDGRRWLDKLLREGWLGAGEARIPGLWRQKSGKSVPSTAQTGADLRELAKRIKTDREEIACRLHELEVEADGKRVDYLPWLTGRLEQMALHIKIKDWLQNSGYPLIKEGDMSARFSAKRSRKQDFSMRLLEAYCVSGRGGGFLGQGRGAGASISGWRLTDDGFCLPDADEVEALREALERSGETCFYIPLAADLRSGCVLFLAGRDIYERRYEKEEEWWRQEYKRTAEEYRRAKKLYDSAMEIPERIADRQELKEACGRRQSACKKAEKSLKRAKEANMEYKATPASLCFDFLRLNKKYLKQFGENPAGAFRLKSVFHKQAKEEGYQDVLMKFIAYCKGECDRTPDEPTPREAVREFDQDPPAGIPKAFRWAFEERSREAEEAFSKSRSRPLEAPGSPPA